MYFLARLAAGAWAAALNRGEISRFSSPQAKLSAALALLKGDLQALKLLPRMFAKRRRLRRLRRLSPAQVKSLLLRHRISLRELSQNVAEP